MRPFKTISALAYSGCLMLSAGQNLSSMPNKKNFEPALLPAIQINGKSEVPLKKLYCCSALLREEEEDPIDCDGCVIVKTTPASPLPDAPGPTNPWPAFLPPTAPEPAAAGSADLAASRPNRNHEATSLAGTLWGLLMVGRPRRSVPKTRIKGVHCH